MKMIHLFKISRLIQAVALSTGLGLGFSASADNTHSYIIDLNSRKVTDLGSLGGDSTHATGINDSGRVVGDSHTAAGVSHAFITGPDGIGVTDLGTLGGNNSYATAINAVGQVVGYSDTKEGLRHAFITGPNGVGMTDLQTRTTLSQMLSDNFIWRNFSEAYGINASGQVVGRAAIQHPNDRDGGVTTIAFITDANGIGPSSLGRGFARGINDAGQVVGYFENPDIHAFITGPNGGGMTDLGTLGGRYSWANDINAAGQVTGYAETSNGRGDAFITGPNGVGMVNLGAINGEPSQGWAINDAGQIAVFQLGKLLLSRVPTAQA